MPKRGVLCPTRIKEQSGNGNVASHLWSHVMPVVVLLQHERERITKSAWNTPLNVQCTYRDESKKGCGGCIPPPLTFNNGFDEYLFFYNFGPLK